MGQKTNVQVGMQIVESGAVAADRADRMTALDEAAYQVPSDEAGGADHANPHGSISGSLRLPKPFGQS
jgi:hypothetical protein